MNKFIDNKDEDLNKNDKVEFICIDKDAFELSDKNINYSNIN